MTTTHRQRGLVVCAAIVIFLFGRNLSARIDDVASTASAAESAAEQAKSSAEEASDSASNAQDTADEASDKADQLCRYGC